MASISIVWWVVAGVALATLAYFTYRYASSGKKKLPVNRDRINRRQESVNNDEKVELEPIEKRKEDLAEATNEPDKRTKLQKLADEVNKGGSD
jgi:anionic cell wall polymer biosynthesis LytR-Cps2A-Psr (LCP) family protein